MSVNANFSGNLEKPVHLELTGSTATTITSAADDSTLTLVSFAFANPTGSPVACTLYWNDGSADRTIWVGSVAAGETKVVIDIPIRLVTGSSIKAKGANTVTVTLIYFRNIQQQ